MTVNIHFLHFAYFLNLLQLENLKFLLNNLYKIIQSREGILRKNILHKNVKNYSLPYC